jgi:SOS-response transcriptional repressor LexA/DNA-binding XRE family transcriptional regulator
MIDIAEELRKIRETTGFSQQKMADLIGIPQRTWSSYESGQTRPKMDVLFALAEKGYPIKGLTTDVVEDMVEEGKISKEEQQLRAKIARFLAENTPPDTPIDENWRRIVDGVYEWLKSPDGRLIENLEKIIYKTTATQIKIHDFESRLSALESKYANLVHLPESKTNPEVEYPAETGNDDGYTAEPEPEYSIQTGNIAFCDDVAAGPPIWQSEEKGWIVDVPRHLIKTKESDYYALRVRGNSMIDALIPDGSMVLIKKSDAPQHGKIQVVWLDARVTLKRMREEEDHSWTLCHEDGTGRTISLGEENLIQGDFVAVLPPATRPRMRGE